MTMDDKLRALAVQALIEEFRKDFHALTAKYLVATEGLCDEVEFNMWMAETTRFNWVNKSNFNPWHPVLVWTRDEHGGVFNYHNLADALLSTDEQSLHINETKYFVRDEKLGWVAHEES